MAGLDQVFFASFWEFDGIMMEFQELSDVRCELSGCFTGYQDWAPRWAWKGGGSLDVLLDEWGGENNHKQCKNGKHKSQSADVSQEDNVLSELSERKSKDTGAKTGHLVCLVCLVFLVGSNDAWTVRISLQLQRGSAHSRLWDKTLSRRGIRGSLVACSTETQMPQMPVPSGKHTKNYGKSPFLMGKSTINGHFQ